MTPKDIQTCIESFQAIVKELQNINEKLNYLCTQGVFVKIDDDLSEN